MAIKQAGPSILQSDVEKAIKEIRNKKTTGDDMCLEMCSNYWEKVV